MTSATNYNDDGYPELPVFHTHAGEKFNGTFSFDTNNVSFDDNEADYYGELSAISFMLPEENFTENFNGPNGIVASDPTTGTTYIDGGRPDYGRQEQLIVGLSAWKPFDGNDLYGKSGTFVFNNYEPNGFTIRGMAIIAPVPEPATWALTGLGFCLAAMMAHRRKAKLGAA